MDFAYDTNNYMIDWSYGTDNGSIVLNVTTIGDGRFSLTLFPLQLLRGWFWARHRWGRTNATIGRRLRPEEHTRWQHGRGYLRLLGKDQPGLENVTSRNINIDYNGETGRCGGHQMEINSTLLGDGVQHCFLTWSLWRQTNTKYCGQTFDLFNKTIDYPKNMYFFPHISPVMSNGLCLVYQVFHEQQLVWSRTEAVKITLDKNINMLVLTPKFFLHFTHGITSLDK